MLSLLSPQIAFPATLFFLSEFFETVGELAFVVRVLTFAYLIYWLYTTLYDAQTVFAISVVIVAYLIFVHSISVILLTIILIVFVLFGNLIQMLCWFSIFPLFGYQPMGMRLQKMYSPEELQAMQLRAQEKLAAGQALTAAEQEALAQLQAGAQMDGMGMGAQLARRGMMR